ncbi:hypothetical protein BY996DRAFT_8683158 [Phakopsora pachyrhizi]|nr:hypothetical protein BY996DRAFT_8683158 [Phakopsora pachyrhizi]
MTHNKFRIKAFKPEEYLYKPADSQIVGLDDNKPLLHPLTVRRCFNCGDSGHSLTGCPEARSKSLIRLTKQIFQANKNNGALDQSNSQQRPTQLLSLSTEATEETLKRRRFLALSFYPGVVSQALREAIFWDSFLSRADPDCLDPERPMPWFQLMEKWGYPLGYAIGSGGNGLDPFEAIKKRIKGSQIDDKNLVNPTTLDQRMQALNRDWERLLTKSSMNHREVVQGVDQVISHLKLLKDLLHCGHAQWPQSNPHNQTNQIRRLINQPVVQDLKRAREQESAAQRLEQDAQQKNSEMQLRQLSHYTMAFDGQKFPLKVEAG